MDSLAVKVLIEFITNVCALNSKENSFERKCPSKILLSLFLQSKSTSRLLVNHNKLVKKIFTYKFILLIESVFVKITTKVVGADPKDKTHLTQKKIKS